MNADTADPTSGAEPAEHRPEESGARRRTLIGAVITLLLAAGGITYGVLTTSDEPETKPVPTAAVTYEVRGSGTVKIDFIAHGKHAKSLTLSGTELPWRMDVKVAVGTEPTVRIVLDGNGGDAGCALAVRGKHVQRSTATGAYGRATCSAPLPAAQNGSDNTSENSETP
ncbi:MmpS family transport accessory protein [Streptomyces niveus]|uniref:MmpS family transport accessory protein n=1 Tax=Streptomyces niveus TaxID=193462 RepID=UPI0036D3609F